MNAVPPLAFAGVDLISALLDNDLIGITCIFALLIMSVISFTFIIFKLIHFRAIQQQDALFRGTMAEEGSWESLFLAAKECPQSPMASLLRDVYVEIRMERWFEGQNHLSAEGKLEIARQTMDNTLQRGIAREEGKLQKHLGFLGTVCSLAPFVGLFGTVWGILASFQAIGREGSAALSSLAPGISTALMTTVFGLIAAIPALVAYNYFQVAVRRQAEAMETFGHDLESAVRRQLLEKGAK